MIRNIDRYKKDLESLLSKGELLRLAMEKECFPAETEKAFKKNFGDDAKAAISVLPSFTSTYQSWYSEAKVLMKQLLPDRLLDFVGHYTKPKPRKELTYESYRIEDYLQGIAVTRGPNKEKVVGPDAALSHFRQQIAILKSVQSRFESSLFDIRQLVQADLFDSELEAAKELSKNGFSRAAGAVAGVVLERHLAEVCQNHGVVVKKKAPGISDFNNALKEANVSDVPTWRFIQHLADIRNLCDHSKKAEPTVAQVDDLIAGVEKVTKSLF